ncbi:GTP 3',8-cyclase MoaA [Acanthopleuribacter pedis]|uniref:GTP 3',8-cyclase n=1 Tax=Acanthopleuribacter pedis TaxID=442870 RepID=A0A8J7Q7R8_9BACT|nr:GTP 3',8-cyclase MoaA [Acanthopleuribacter pedis]MBO1318409.1 GTP 3',8-cyclase MoaA [Acanthopleuribacter pedis]
MIRDQRKRPLRDLRISVTDRCNFRCGYCMPSDRTYTFLPKNQLLSFEEITRIARAFAALGVTKLRLTGGEPLLRRDLPLLIAMLKEIDGIEDIALTTNGSRLGTFAADLVAAGLSRATVSLDSLRPEVFTRLADTKVPLESVLAQIDTALAAGLPLKTNTVVQKGVNQGECAEIVAYFRARGVTPRFIEFMDVGNLNAWQRDHVFDAAQIAAQIGTVFPHHPLPPRVPGETARRFGFDDGPGEFGIIASVTQPFCGACSRVRLSAQGRVYHCLFAAEGYDLKSLVRDGADQETLVAAIATAWRARTDRYSEERGAVAPAERTKVEMYHIGG